MPSSAEPHCCKTVERRHTKKHRSWMIRHPLGWSQGFGGYQFRPHTSSSARGGENMSNITNPLRALSASIVEYSRFHHQSRNLCLCFYVTFPTSEAVPLEAIS